MNFSTANVTTIFDRKYASELNISSQIYRKSLNEKECILKVKVLNSQTYSNHGSKCVLGLE